MTMTRKPNKKIEEINVAGYMGAMAGKAARIRALPLPCQPKEGGE